MKPQKIKKYNLIFIKITFSFMKNLSILILSIFVAGCCPQKNIIKKNRLTHIELAFVNPLMTFSTPMTEDRLMIKAGESARRFIIKEDILKKINNQLIKLKPYKTDGKSIWLSALLHYDNYHYAHIGFSAYSSGNYIKYNNEHYHWNQELANIFYSYISKEVLDDLPKEIK